MAERLNRTLVEAARSMLTQACLPNIFWAEDVAAATYLRNRMVTTALKSGKTPYHLWKGKKLNLEHIRVFGCAAYVHIPDSEHRKLDKKASKLRFMGYTDTEGNYKVWNETKRKCYVCHDVIFNEHDFGQHSSTEIEQEQEETTEESVRDIKINLDDQDKSKKEEKQVATEPPQRSGQVRKQCVRYGTDEYVTCHVALQASEVEEPEAIAEALSGSNSKKWKAAADDEYRSLIENDT